jgi:hypothetical protein
MFSFLSQFSLRKTLVALAVAMFTVTAVYVPQVHQQTPVAHAQADAWANIKAYFLQVYENITSTATWALQQVETYLGLEQSIITRTLNGLAWALAKETIAQIQKSIVRWINSGFQGSPAFIQDLEQFLLDVADRTAGDYIERYGGPLSIACAPFRLNIQIALSTSYNRLRDGNRRRCTLSGTLQNIQSFVEGNFQSGGGWNQWLRFTQQSNSYASQLLDAEVGMSITIANARGQRITTSGWGRGFLSVEACDEATSPTYRWRPQFSTSSARSQGQQAARPNCRITTPGDVISTQLNSTLGLSGDTLVEADQINEIIGSFMRQVVVQAVTGPNGLLSLGGGQGSNARFTNPQFNIDMVEPSLAGAVGTTQVRSLANEAVQNETRFLAIAQATVARFERSTAPNNDVREQSLRAYNEARSALPVIQTNLTEARRVLTELDTATSAASQQLATQRYMNAALRFHSSIFIDQREQSWNFALSGMVARRSGTLDRQGMIDQRDLERDYRRLINSAIDAYEDLTNPSAAQTSAVSEARTLLPEVQERIITLTELIEEYDNGDTEDALADFEAFLPERTTDETLANTRTRWETAFGILQ